MPPHNIDKSAFRKGEYSGYTGYGLYEIARSRVGGWRARLRESDRRSEYYANGLLPSEFEGRTLDEVSRELDAIRRGIEESGVSFALERDTLGNPYKRRSNPAFTTGELQRMQREVDRLMFPDGLSGKPKAKPKATYQIEIRHGRQVLETAKFKTRKAAEAKFADAVAFSAQSNDPRFAGLSVYLCINGQDVDHFTQPAKSKRKANPYHGTPAPPNSLMAKGEFVGVVRVDELDRLKKSADAPLMCYVFISGQGYQVRKFKSREALHKAVTESGSVGPANEFPHYWKEMVPPVVSYRRGR